MLQGTPTAYFPNTSCDLETAFGPNNIIINLTFCESIIVIRELVLCLLSRIAGGDWAGVASVFSGAGCPGDCVGKYCPITLNQYIL